MNATPIPARVLCPRPVDASTVAVAYQTWREVQRRRRRRRQMLAFGRLVIYAAALAIVGIVILRGRQ